MSRDHDVPPDHEIVAQAVAIIESATAASSKLADTPTRPPENSDLLPVGSPEGVDNFSWRDQDQYNAEFNRLTGLTEQGATILIRAIRGGWGWTLV